MPATPLSVTRRGLPSRTVVWKSCLSSCSSSSRPTNGGSRRRPPPPPRSPPDTVRLSAPRPPPTATPRDDADRLPDRDRLLLALELPLARGLERDRLIRCSIRCLRDEDRARLRRRLEARRRVDHVARNHPLALEPDRDRGLASQHTGSRFEHSGSPQPRGCRHRAERGPHRP